MERAIQNIWALILILVVAASLVFFAIGPAYGAHSWTYEYGEPSPDSFSSANAVGIASDGSIYVVGAYFGTFEGHVAVDDFDTFVMKLTPSGAVEWTRSWDPFDRPWDPDLSDLSLYFLPAWSHPPDLGDVAFDGAGNIIVTMRDSIAIFQSDGTMTASRDNIQEHLNGGFMQSVEGQADSDGGVLVAFSGGKTGVTAFDANLDVQWGPTDDYRGRVSIIATDDGGAVVVADSPGEFSFQVATQIVEKFDGTGASIWSVVHNGRCSTYSGSGPIPAFQSGGNVVVLSSEVSTPECLTPDGSRFMSSYSLSTGEWIGDRQLLPSTGTSDYIPFACARDGSIPTVVDGWQEQVSCSSDETYLRLYTPYPRSMSSATQAGSLVPIAIGANGAWEPAVVSFTVTASAFQLDEAIRFPNASASGTDVLGYATTPNGTSVLVGRAGNSVSIPTTSSSDPVIVAGVNQPHAFVVFNPIAAPPPWGTFIDDDDSVFEADIEWMAAHGITKGCNPPTNDLFCPDSTVTRGQMAAFLVRALGLTDDGGGDLFTDDDESIFEGDIDRMATAGITKGCNPPDNDRFCPDSKVTRGQMAAFLVRALGYTDDGGGDLFIDDDDSIFESDIDKLGTAGVTKGCNPPVNDMYCPSSVVTRGQMAAFLHRAIG